MRVTTDTQEYCEALAERVERAEHVRQPRPAQGDELEQVKELASEGHQMCIAGRIRSGLVRLRRALLLLSAQN